jgi:hypothetical protein
MTEPFGWTRDQVTGQLLPAAEEQRAIRHAAYYHGQGYSLAGVVRALDRDGFRNRQGRPLSTTSVRRLLLRVERYGVPPVA